MTSLTDERDPPAAQPSTSIADPVTQIIAAMQNPDDWRSFLAFAGRFAGRHNARNLLHVYRRFSASGAHPPQDETPGSTPPPLPVPLDELADLVRAAVPDKSDPILASLATATKNYGPAATPRARAPKRTSRPTAAAPTNGPNQFTAPTSRGPLQVSVSTDWKAGRVRYIVAGIGTFIIEPDPHDHDRGTSGHIHLQYGDDPAAGDYRASSGYRSRPNAPVINTIAIVGAAVFNPARAEPTRHHWLVVYRSRDHYSSCRVPDKTALRTAEIVHSLVTHWTNRADLDEIKTAHARAHAPRRLRGHEETINRLHEQIAQLQDELADAEANAAAQRALITA